MSNRIIFVFALLFLGVILIALLWSSIAERLSVERDIISSLGRTNRQRKDRVTRFNAAELRASVANDRARVDWKLAPSDRPLPAAEYYAPKEPVFDQALARLVARRKILVDGNVYYLNPSV